MGEITLRLTEEIIKLNERYGILSSLRSVSLYTKYAKHVSQIDEYRKSIEGELRDLVFHEYKYQFLLPEIVSKGKTEFVVEKEP